MAGGREGQSCSANVATVPETGHRPGAVTVTLAAVIVSGSIALLKVAAIFLFSGDAGRIVRRDRGTDGGRGGVHGRAGREGPDKVVGQRIAGKILDSGGDRRGINRAWPQGGSRA